MQTIILRYGHRQTRDQRATTHCCLVARAFGAQKIIIDGEQDKELKKTINKITKKWGGKFNTTFTNSWKKTIQKYKKHGFKIIHLTMYGLPIKKELQKIKKHKKIIIIIGSQKVEKQVYDTADYNISITNQPHSEIAALAVFLHETIKTPSKFENAKIKIIPNKKTKHVQKML